MHAPYYGSRTRSRIFPSVRPSSLRLSVHAAYRIKENSMLPPIKEVKSFANLAFYPEDVFTQK